MKINKQQLEALLALPDDQLWREAVRMAASYGISLPKETPPKEQLDKLRGVAGSGRISARDAFRLISEYKRRK